MRGTRVNSPRHLKAAIEDEECHRFRRAIKAHEHALLDVIVDGRHPTSPDSVPGLLVSSASLVRSTRCIAHAGHLASASMLRAAALVAMLSPLAFCLATRQDPGPCDVNACHAVIDSSACWNAYVTGAIREELTGIYDCAPGGKSEVRRDGPAPRALTMKSTLTAWPPSCVAARAATACCTASCCRTGSAAIRAHHAGQPLLASGRTARLHAGYGLVTPACITSRHFDFPAVSSRGQAVSLVPTNGGFWHREQWV